MKFDKADWLRGMPDSPRYVRTIARAIADRADRFGEVQFGVRDLRATPGIKPSEVNLALQALRVTDGLTRIREGRQGDPATWQLTYTARRAAGARRTGR